MLSYEATMRIGADRYRPVLDALAAEGWQAEFTQTGGMCAALQVTLEGGYTLLITNEEDPLSWDPEERVGWGVGFYVPNQDHTETLVFASTEDSSIEALLRLIPGVIRDGIRVLRGR